MSHPSLHTLVDAAKFILNEIAVHPDFQVLDYQPDLTIGDAQSAIVFLKHELEGNRKTPA